MISTAKMRVFFALWPDAGLRAELAKRRDSIATMAAARPVLDYNLHLTLHYIGNVMQDELSCLQRQARTVAARRFELTLDCQGYFKRPQVAWFGSSSPPRLLLELHSRLGQALQTCRFEPETRPYQPHITVMRKLPSPPASQKFEPLRWAIDRFVLIQSNPGAGGARYTQLENYPLQ